MDRFEYPVPQEKLRTTFRKRDYLCIYGKKADIEKTKAVLDSIQITGNSDEDSLLMQELIEDRKLRSTISVDGHTVYPYKKLIKEFEGFIRTGSILKMTDAMYNFLYMNFDIAHYDKYGYIAYYDGSWQALYKQTLYQEFRRRHRMGSTQHIIDGVEAMLNGTKEPVLEELRKKEELQKGIKRNRPIPNYIEGQFSIFDHLDNFA